MVTEKCRAKVTMVFDSKTCFPLRARWMTDWLQPIALARAWPLMSCLFISRRRLAATVRASADLFMDESSVILALMQY